jgi:ABC-2 type transport system permease protein
MTTITPYVARGSALSFGGLLRSEWIKLRTLRSTIWCYAIIVAITIGLGLLIASAIQSSTINPSSPGNEAIVQVATLGIAFSQLVAAVLGALLITGEYGTGMIRSTLTAVPKRLPALAAKAIVLAVTTFALGLVSIVVTALVATPILTAKNIPVDLADGKVWFAIVGGAGYLALIALLALAVGTIVRNSAGGISAALGLVFVAPIVFQIIAGITQATWAINVLALLPSSAGGRMYAYVSDVAAPASKTIVLDPFQGFLVLAVWVIAFFVVASVLLKRRDA